MHTLNLNTTLFDENYEKCVKFTGQQKYMPQNIVPTDLFLDYLTTLFRLQRPYIF
jgi:hypothetical protein